MEIAAVSLNDFQHGTKNVQEETAQRAYESFRTTGLLFVHDPSVDLADVVRAQAMMDRYFAQGETVLMRDARPEVHFQTGYLPRKTERPNRNLRTRIIGMPRRHWPTIPPWDYDGDDKHRFFYPFGEQPPETPFDKINPAPVVPAGFEGEWKPTLDKLCCQLLGVGTAALAMIERALGASPGRITDLLKYAPHLLGPNAADLSTTKIGTIINAAHTDLNAVSVHPAATYPGLRIWSRDNTLMSIKIPPGYFLLQAGQQLEWVTGGEILAGLHEVIATEEAVGIYERHPSQSPRRISLPLFVHFASSARLEVLEEILAEQSVRERRQTLTLFPPITIAEQVTAELEAINLKQS